MKTCPRCGGQVRPSVIRCIHCGNSLLEEPQPATVGAPGSGAGGAGAPGSRSGGLGSDRVASRGATATPAAPVAPAPSPSTPTPPTDVWVTPSVRADVRAPAPIDPTPRQPTPSVAPRRQVDPVLIVAGVLAVAAAVLTYVSLSMPWVQARIVTTDARLRQHVVADLTFTASDSFAAQLGIGLAIVFAMLGLVWFWYGLDQGAPLPWVAHVVVVVSAAVVGAAVVGLAQLGYFFWDDAFVAHAREAGMTKDAMNDVLTQHPAPLIEVQRLTGVVRFGMAVALALLAGIVAWWAQRRRYA